MTLSQPSGAPPLHWTLRLGANADGTQRGEAEVSGTEARARALITGDWVTGFTWKINDGAVELKMWSGGVLQEGRATLAGSGTWQGSAATGNLRVELSQLSVGDLVELVDAKHDYVSRAVGKANGHALVQLSESGPVVTEVELAVADGTTALIYFHPTPGLLTASLPPQVVRLYPGLISIEEGRTPLETKVLQFHYQPQPDASGRTARIHLEGRPLDPKLIAPVDLDFNVSGPFEQLIKKALDTRVRLGGK